MASLMCAHNVIALSGGILYINFQLATAFIIITTLRLCLAYSQIYQTTNTPLYALLMLNISKLIGSCLFESSCLLTVLADN